VQKPKLSFYFSYFTIFALSLALNLAQAFYISSPFDQLASDMLGYVERGVALAIAAPAEAFENFFPPGTSYFYSLFFAAFGVKLGAVAIIIAQAAMISGASFYCGQTAEQLFNSKKTGLIIALSTALYFPFIAQSSFFMAEPLFFFCLMVSQFLLAKVVAVTNPSTKALLFKFFVAGLFLGFATLAKGQGAAVFIANLMAIATPLFSSRRKLVPLFIVGFFCAVAIAGLVRFSRTGNVEFYIGSNDSYNLYIGQSRHAAVGCYDPEHGYFHIFYNNNWAFDRHLQPLEIVETSILNRDYFKQRTLKLWQEAPLRQIVRSTESVFELLKFFPDWPLRNVKELVFPDVTFQILSFILVSLPALFAVVLALTRGYQRWIIFFFTMPLIGGAAMAFVYMGQPRYLIPFKYFTFLLAIPAYQIFFQQKFKIFQKYILEILISLLLILTTIIFRYYIHDAYIRTSTPRLDGTQEHYATLSDLVTPEKIKLWLELGKDNTLIKSRLATAAADIDLLNFSVGNTWARNVHWFVSTDKHGAITLQFEPGTFSNIAVFMTDGDSYWRASKVSSGNTTTIAQQLHDGRWLAFPVTTEENKAGAKTIAFNQLTGDDIAISAIIAW